MVKPTFKNRENIAHKIDGKEVWESRSSAVNTVVLGIFKDSIFVLTEKRSATMPDEPGKWCIPSGYFDYDEDAAENAIREIWEETGLYLPDFKNDLVYASPVNKPFLVQTSPKENRQNIILYYCYIYDFYKGLPDVEKYKNKEIDQAKWMEISEVFTDKYVWAFNHDLRIEEAVNEFQKYLI